MLMWRQLKFFHILVGSLVLIGAGGPLLYWVSKSQRLNPDEFPVMALSTALLFCFSGFNLCSCKEKSKSLKQLRRLIAVLILLFSLTSLFLSFDPVVSSVFKLSDLPLNEAVGFALLAGSLLLLEANYLRIAQIIANILMLFAFLNLDSLLKHYCLFEHNSQLADITLESVVGLFIASLAIIFLVNDRDCNANLFRRLQVTFLHKQLLPLTLLIILVFWEIAPFIQATELLSAVDKFFVAVLLPSLLLAALFFLAVRKKAGIEARKPFIDCIPAMARLFSLNDDWQYYNRHWLDYCGKGGFPRRNDEFLECMHPEDVAQARQVYRQGLNDKRGFSCEFRLRHRDGRYRWINERTKPYFDENKVCIGFIAIAEDIHEQKKIARKFCLNELIVENSEQGIIVTDRQNNIIYANTAFTKISGYSFAEVSGKNPNILKSNHHDDDFYQQMWEGITSQKYWRGEIWCRNKAGEIFQEQLTIIAITDDHDLPLYYLGFMKEVGQKSSEDEGLYLAHHDKLTGFANHLLLQDRLDRALKYAQITQERLAILCLDIDHFSSINAQHGQLLGDLLLLEFAKRLKECTREDDLLARIFGDEFVVMLPNINNRNEAYITARVLQDNLSRPYHLGKICINSSASIGIATFPDNGFSGKDLLRTADTAMYRAKKNGESIVMSGDEDK